MDLRDVLKMMKFICLFFFLVLSHRGAKCVFLINMNEWMNDKNSLFIKINQSLSLCLCVCDQNLEKKAASQNKIKQSIWALANFHEMNFVNFGKLVFFVVVVFFLSSINFVFAHGSAELLCMLIHTVYW